jgi:hypothetical protein
LRGRKPQDATGTQMKCCPFRPADDLELQLSVEMHDQGEQDAQVDVLGTAWRCQSREGAEGQDAGEGDRTGLEVGRRRLRCCPAASGGG